MDTLGVDIGTTSIKYLLWRGRRGRGAVVSQGELPYDGTWESLDQAAAALRTREGTKVALSMSITSQNIVKKTFTIPVLPKKELREALNWSASKVVSTPLDDMNYEYVMLGQVSEKGIQKEEILFVGTEKAYLGKIIAAFRQAGFADIVLVTDLGSCFLPIVQKVKGASVAVVDIGGKQTGMYIFDGRKARLVREIMTASESFTDALMTGLNLSYEEAEAYKIQKGFDEGSKEALFTPMERLAGELRRTLKVYVQRYPDKPIAKVCVTGRGSRIPNFLETLQYHVDEEVEMLAAPAAIDEDFIPAYMAAARKETLLNLLPADVKLRRKELEYGRWARIGTAAVVSALIIFSLNSMAHYNRFKNEAELEKRKLAEKQASLAALKQTASQSRYNELLGAQKDLKERSAVLLTVLKYFSAYTPREIYLREIEFGPAPAADASKPGAAAGDAQKPPPPTPAPAKDGKNLQETVKDAVKADEDPFRVRLRGYVFGEADTWEPALADLLIRMEQSRFFSEVQVSGKTAKELRGRSVMEFSLTARCRGYEI